MKTSLSFSSAKRPCLFIIACWVVFCFDIFAISPRNVTFHDVAARASSANADNLANLSHRSAAPLETSSVTDKTLLDAESSSSGEHLLTAILPVTGHSLFLLQDRLSTLFSLSHLHEVLLLCGPEHQSEARSALFQVFSRDKSDRHPDVLIFGWPLELGKGPATLYAAQHIDTPPDRILILDEDGLDPFNSETRSLLVGRFSTPLPVGPRGFEARGDEISCIAANTTPNAASFLVPPFSVAPLLVPPHDLPVDSEFDIWVSLGQHISRARYEGFGGVALDYDHSSSWCTRADAESNIVQQETVLPLGSATENLSGNFAVILPSLSDLFSFASLVCRLLHDGHDTRVLLTENLGDAHQPGTSILLQPLCALKVDVLSLLHISHYHASPESWLASLSTVPNVVFTVPAAEVSKNGLPASVTLIQIPHEDLPFCDWMSTLPLTAWRNWHVPQLEVSVITNDRPESLSRLLSSLSTASFFGDMVHLRINVEQTADEETLRLVNTFQWNHGAKFVHRRVIQGGLLPAVVESWYPSSNDSYGLMLEDDVELSPLFYAWVKMSLLTYRYGKPEDMSAQLFGISLYQQKNLELRPEGRHPFSAQKLFSAASYAHPNTPYLSQIPCSWGAVYFPEQWREFHDYLAVRLSESHPDLPINGIVTPGVRSNKWTRSWKKYFIELVYLRGYVMLYPNFGQYVSLSTNHLEVGSHVKEMSQKAYERKKKLYLLPLMQRPLVEPSDLMDLPEERMPPWAQLPVLDLLGLFATETTLQERGAARRADLFGCEEASRPLDIQSLLCLSDEEES